MRASEFFKECQAHDWYYDFSDDGDVYRRGKANEVRLQGIARRVEGVFGRIWDDWSRYVGRVIDTTHAAPRPKVEDYDFGDDADFVVEGPNAKRLGLSVETQRMLEDDMAWQKGIARAKEEQAERLAIFSHPDGAVAAIMVADKDTLRRMCDIRNADVAQIVDRLEPKESDPSVRVIYGAEFAPHPSGKGLVHTQPDGKRMHFDCMRRMVLYIAARWH